MTVVRSSHPSPLILELFDEGRLDDGGVAAVLAHLDICPECGQLVMTRPPTSRLRQMRGAQPASGTIPGISVEQATKAAEEPPEEPLLDNLPADVPLDLPSELKDHKQYKVERELGRGGMGVVYLARDQLMNRLVVLKVVNSLLVRDPGMRERFLREIQLAATLRHPNVATAHHAEQIGQLLVLVMEYAPGETLEVMMTNRAGRPLPVVNACYYAQQVARGLQHAFEQGLVHRDIKPSNLILTVTQKKTHLVRILDFGLAKARSDNEASTAGLTGTGAMMGTPAYMAPEQGEDAARADIRADIYSLGCTLYFLLTGRPPFVAKNVAALLRAHASQEAVLLSQLRADVPGELSAVVARMMAKEPSERYQKPEEVVKALAPFLAGGKKLEPQPESQPETRVAPGGKTRVGKRESSVVAAGVKPGGVIPPTVLERPASGDERKKPVKPRGRWVWVVMGAGALLSLLVLGLWASGAFRPKDHSFATSQGLDTEWSQGGLLFATGKPLLNTKRSDGGSPTGRESTNRVYVDTGRASTSKMPPDTGRAGDGLLSGERWQEFTYYLDSTPHKGSRRVVTRDLGGGVKMDFVRIAAKGKTFTMGSPVKEDGHFKDEVEHKVTLSADYYLGMTAVTRGQFAAFVKDDGYKTEAESVGDKYTWQKLGFEQTDELPVVCVSWNDAQAFCKWLKRKDDREYSLPSEAQWECACRAGTNTAYSFGNDAKQLGDHAWYSANSGGSTHPVGAKNPNPWGLYDMHGNVMQWCSDGYGDYPTEAVSDPLGPSAKEDSIRVIRGGSWFNTPRYCRSASRRRNDPSGRSSDLGFRVAVPVRSQ